MRNSNFVDYGDILDVEDISKLLNISKRSAREFIKANGGLLISGKWLIGKVKVMELFSM